MKLFLNNFRDIVNCLYTYWNKDNNGDEDAKIDGCFKKINFLVTTFQFNELYEEFTKK